MKKLIGICLILLSTMMFAQTTPTASTGAFPSTMVTVNLAPMALPGNGSTVAGAETDLLMSPSNSFAFGPSTIVSPSMVFLGGKANYYIKPLSTWIQNNSPNWNGYQWQVGPTVSFGTVKPVGVVGNGHYAERAGIVINYAINGSWGTALDLEWGNFVGVKRNTWTISLPVNFHF